VPEVQNLDHALVFSDLVVGQNRTVNQFAYTRSLSDGPAHARKIDQKVYVVEEGFAKTRSGLVIVFGYVRDDFS